MMVIQYGKKTKSGKDKKSRKNTSLRLDSSILKELKIKAIEDDISIQNVLETLVAGYLNGKFRLD